MSNFIILTPTFNDWQSLNKLLLEADKNIKGLKGNFRVLIINDASTIKPKLDLKNIKRLRNIQIITLKKNSGSQKSICIGLKYLKKKKTKAIITIIDSDGEDDPKHIKKLFPLFIMQVVDISKWMTFSLLIYVTLIIEKLKEPKEWIQMIL